MQFIRHLKVIVCDNNAFVKHENLSMIIMANETKIFE